MTEWNSLRTSTHDFMVEVESWEGVEFVRQPSSLINECKIYVLRRNGGWHDWTQPNCISSVIFTEDAEPINRLAQ